MIDENKKDDGVIKKFDDKKVDNIKKEINDDDDYRENVDVKKLLHVLLLIIIIITMGCGIIVYYSIYKYSNETGIIEPNVNQNEETKTVANMLDSALKPNKNANTNTNTDAATTLPEGVEPTVPLEEVKENETLNKEIIVLYKGLILDAKEMATVKLKYIDNANPNKDNYVVTYYNYENYTYKDSALGTLSNQIIEGYVKIDNVGKVAISEKYEAIPREIQVINSIPKTILDLNPDFNNYDSTKTVICDLDGDLTNEYIVILANKANGNSKIALVETNGTAITLGSMEKAGWEEIAADGYYLSYNNLELIDIDNDGIMEILFELPTKDQIPSEVSVLKYNKGKLSGKTDITCSLK